MRSPETDADEDTAPFQPIREASERLQLLERIRRHRAPIHVFCEDGGNGRSRLLAIDSDATFLVLDQLSPPPKGGVLPRGAALHCVADVRGARVRFDTEVRARGKRDGRILYKVDFPARMERRQRRAYFRVPVPMHLGYHVQLTLPDGETLQGEVADLSSVGVGIRLAPPIPEALEVGLALPETRLHLGLPQPLTCELQACNLRQLSERRWHLGCRITDIHPAHQTALDRVVFTLDRELCKRELG